MSNFTTDLPESYQHLYAPAVELPAQDPSYGRYALFTTSAKSAFNYGITTSSWRYAKYTNAGMQGTPIDEEEFKRQSDKHGLTDRFEYKKGMTLEQFNLMKDYTKEQDRYNAILHGSSRGKLDVFASLAGSFAGSMADPVELATMAVPALQIENWIRRGAMETAFKMPMSRIKQMRKYAPELYQNIFEANAKTLKPASLGASIHRGAVIAEAEAVIREPLIYGFNDAMQVEYTPADSILNLTVAPIMGGFLHGLGHVASKHWLSPTMHKALTEEELSDSAVFLQNELNSSFKEYASRMDYIEGRHSGIKAQEGKLNADKWIEFYFDDVLGRGINKQFTQTEFDFSPESVTKMVREMAQETEVSDRMSKDFVFPWEGTTFGEPVKGAKFIGESPTTGRSVFEFPIEVRPKTPAQRASERLSYDRLYARSADPVTTGEKALANMYQRAFGTRIRFIDGTGDQGTVMSKHAGTLFISNANKAKMSYIAGHEFLHSLKWRNPKLFLEFSDLVLKYDNGTGLMKASMKRMLSEQNFDEVKALSPGKQIEESLGNIFGEIASDENFWKHMKSNMEPTKWEALKKDISQFFADLIRGLHETLEFFGIKDTRMLIEEPERILDVLPDEASKKLVREASELFKTFNVESDFSRQALDNFFDSDAAFDARIGTTLEEKAGRVKWRKQFFGNVQRWNDEIDDMVNIVAEGSEQDAIVALNPTKSGVSTLTMPKSHITGDVNNYAIHLMSSKHPTFAELRADYIIVKSRLLGDQNVSKGMVKQYTKWLKENAKNLAKAKKTGDKRDVQLLQARQRNLNKMKDQQFQEMDARTKELEDLAEDVRKQMLITVEPSGDDYVFRWAKVDEGQKAVYKKFKSDTIEAEGPVSGGIQQIREFNEVTRQFENVWYDPTTKERLSWEEAAEELNIIAKEDDLFANHFVDDEPIDLNVARMDAATYKAHMWSRSSGDSWEDIPLETGFWDWQTESQRRLGESYEEVADRMTTAHVKGLETEGSNHVKKTEGTLKRTLRGAFDRLSTRLSDDQVRSENVFKRNRNEASMLQGATPETRLKVLLDGNHRDFNSEFRFVDEAVWEGSKPIHTGDDAEGLAKLTTSERALYDEMTILTRYLSKRAFAMKGMANAGHFAKPKHAFMRSVGEQAQYSKYSAEELSDMYKEGRQAHIKRRRMEERGEMDKTNFAEDGDYIFNEQWSKSRGSLGNLIQMDRVRKNWVSRALHEGKHSKDWLLSSLDGIHRKGVAPDTELMNVTSRVKARVARDVEPLVHALGEHFQDFTARDSNLARKVFLFIETADQRILEGSPEVKLIADTLVDLNRAQVHRLRKNGSMTPHRDAYTISVRHNASAIKRAGFESWSNEISERLDWDETFDRLGVSLDPDARNNSMKKSYLKSVFDDITSGKFRDADDAVDEYLASIGKETTHARTMIFKSGQIFDYDQNYGSGAPAHALLEQVQRRAEVSEMMELLGPNPRKAWGRIKESLGLKDSDLRTKHLDSLVNYHLGEMDNPVNKRWAEWGQMARAFANATFLGNAGISAMVDSAHSISTLKFLGVDLGTMDKAYWGSLKRAWKRQDSGFQTRMRGQAAGMDALLGAGSRRMTGEVPGSTAVRGMNDWMFRVNGLNMWTTIAQEAMVDIVNRSLPDMLNDADFVKMLGRYGVNADDVAVMKRAASEVEDVDGKTKMITPDLIEAIDADTAQKMRVFLDDWMRQGVLEPDASSQIFGRFGLRSGTMLGEAVRTVTQYMPFGLAVYQKTYRRMLNGYSEQGFGALMGDSRNRRIAHMLSFVGWSAAIGFITGNVKDLLRGREPNYLFNMDSMKARKWIYQSGIGGPLSDLLWVRDKSDVAEVAAGPFFGAALDVGTSLVTDDVPGIMLETERNLPFSNLPALGEMRRNVLEWVIGDAYVEGIDRHGRLVDSDE